MITTVVCKGTDKHCKDSVAEHFRQLDTQSYPHLSDSLVALRRGGASITYSDAIHRGRLRWRCFQIFEYVHGSLRGCQH